MLLLPRARERARFGLYALRALKAAIEGIRQIEKARLEGHTV